MAYLMGLDIGTKNVHCSVFNEYSACIADSTFDYSTRYFVNAANPEWAFVQPEELWNAVVLAIRHTSSQLSNPAELTALAVTGIGMDGLPIDKNGKPLYPFISWQCSRTKPQCDRVISELGERKIFDLTGRQSQCIDSVYRIMWFRENYPALYDKTFKWLLLEDFINYKLCGAMVTDYSMASTTALFDQKTLNWSASFLKYTHINADILPQLEPSGTYLGNISAQTAELTGLSTETRVILGGHDYLCAMLSRNACEKGTIFNIVGSWDMTISAVDKPLLSKSVYEAGLKLESHIIPGKYAIVGDAVSTYHMDNYLRLVEPNGLSDVQRQQRFLAADNVECGSGGVFFLPHCNGANSPTPDTRSSGALIGLNDFISQETILRAVMEGLNYQAADMYCAFERALKRKIDTVMATGYDSNNPVLMKNRADVTGKIIRVSKIKSATCLGAALLAGVGCGAYENISEAEHFIKAEDVVYVPDKEKHKRYQDYYQIYKQIYPALMNLNHQISMKFQN